MRIKELTAFSIFLGYLMCGFVVSTFYPVLAPFLSLIVSVIAAVLTGMFGLIFCVKLSIVQSIFTSASICQMTMAVGSLSWNGLIFSDTMWSAYSFLGMVLVFTQSIMIFIILNVVSSMALYFVIRHIGLVKRLVY